MKLISFSQALGFEVWKGYFPIFFSTAENQNYAGPHQQPEYRGVDSIMLGEGKQFFAYPTSNKEKIFLPGKRTKLLLPTGSENFEGDL